MWLPGAIGMTGNCWLAMHMLKAVLPHAVLPKEPRAHVKLLQWPTHYVALWPRSGGSWTCQAPEAPQSQAQFLLDGCCGGPAKGTRVSGLRRRRSPRSSHPGSNHVSLILRVLPGRDCGRTVPVMHQVVPALRAPQALSSRVSAEVIVNALPPVQRHVVLWDQSRPQANLDAAKEVTPTFAVAAAALPVAAATIARLEPGPAYFPLFVAGGSSADAAAAAAVCGPPARWKHWSRWLRTKTAPIPQNQPASPLMRLRASYHEGDPAASRIPKDQRFGQAARPRAVGSNPSHPQSPQALLRTEGDYLPATRGSPTNRPDALSSQ